MNRREWISNLKRVEVTNREWKRLEKVVSQKKRVEANLTAKEAYLAHYDGGYMHFASFASNQTGVWLL